MIDGESYPIGHKESNLQAPYKLIKKRDTGKDDKAYHDMITLLKIYRSVNRRMQVKIRQVKRQFQAEYGSDVDEFLNQIYEAGLLSE